jgi:plastocyanin
MHPLPIFFSTAACVVLLHCSAAYATSVGTVVTDGGGKPLVDAVVYLEPVGGKSFSKPQQTAEIEQKARKFMPLVSVVQTGTPILFPNNDKVRHHVYSFSPAKTFELKLYSGVPGSPLEFDKPGTVVVGCNIHDKMVAYIQVVDTPYFSKTDAAGKALIRDVPAGKYTLKAWHPGLPHGAKPEEQPLEVGTADVETTIRLTASATGL